MSDEVNHYGCHEKSLVSYKTSAEGNTIKLGVVVVDY